MTRAADDRMEVLPRTEEECSAAGFSIRPARPEDAEILVNLVHELAVYEKLEQHARATPDDFRRHLFGPRPAAEAAVAEVDGEPVGFALWFSHVFDVPRPAGSVSRGHLREAGLSRPRDRQRAAWPPWPGGPSSAGCGRLEWSVLNWNAPAIGFYRALGARPMDEWTVYRIDDEPLRRLAAIAPRSSSFRNLIERIRVR